MACRLGSCVETPGTSSGSADEAPQRLGEEFRLLLRDEASRAGDRDGVTLIGVGLNECRHVGDASIFGVHSENRHRGPVVFDEAMGLGRSSLYNAFGGKSSLFARCLAPYAGYYGEKYDRVLVSHADDVPAAHAADLLDRQRTRLRAALINGEIHQAAAEDIALQLVAVNQSLAALSRAGISDEQL